MGSCLFLKNRGKICKVTFNLPSIFRNPRISPEICLFLAPIVARNRRLNFRNFFHFCLFLLGIFDDFLVKT